jgi:hypothetical protein
MVASLIGGMGKSPGGHCAAYKFSKAKPERYGIVSATHKPDKI